MIDRPPGPRLAGPHIIDLKQASVLEAGGKAQGLARLIAAGLRVPEGFAIIGATAGSLPDDLEEHYQSLGSGAVAVRSSAIGEDSEDASFAGQYETLLDVRGLDALRTAIVECLESLGNERAGAYRSEHGAQEVAPRMCVVVQRMVPARAAGVLFTVDPTTHRRAHVVIDAVEGLGEDLVSGTASPDHYVLTRNGSTVAAEWVGGEPIIDSATRKILLHEAFVAEERLGAPLDLEWAVDSTGVVYWLQARPITTLGADPNEFDTPDVDPSDAFTRCNIGEMFPGAATPLSISFTARSIDVGLQMMHMAVGIQPERSAQNRFVASFYGHLFLNLTAMSDIATQALGSSADQMCMSLCGRRVTEVEIDTRPPPPVLRRVGNGLRYARYVLSQGRARREIRAIADGLRFPETGSAAERWQAIEDRFENINLGMHYHLISSAGAGVLTPTLLGVLAGGKDPDPEHHGEVAGLLAGAEDVESADIVAGVLRIQEKVRAHPEGRTRFVEAAAEDALAWLRSEEAADAGAEFRSYLERHGHRAVKELEVHQDEWQRDPLPLIASIQAPLRSRTGSRTSPSDPAPSSPTPSEDPAQQRAWPLRRLIGLARSAVRSREETKSGLVQIMTHFKRAYRDLAEQMVSEGLLPDPDALFFLTHSELGALARSERPLAATAVARREIFSEQMGLRFAEVFAGEPKPLTPESFVGTGEKRVQGTPVSRGSVTGVARVVLRLEDATKLESGEILVAPVTDVGWTPYFSLIGGLVTDIGSAVSHGAVVAREFGLPAVVNTRSATSVFRTGDLITLDGSTGRVELSEPGDQSQA